ncbi:protein SRG1-like [Chenopodium quinoa]|uniref:protein SRG1-like n=1 Tax=Chenopodium quinoa TaxID=63459 RepID=UPI000B79190C|nr:protein SRG1-like [Chenopodium quinoa]
MPEPASITKEELTSKLVQELTKNGDEIPEIYLHKDGFPEAIDAPELWRDNLLIDFSLLSSSTQELAKLQSALSEWGCFQVINHGMDTSFLEELIEVSKQFFALPLEEKLKCSAADDVFQGYGSDSVFAGAQTINWNDRLFLTLYPEKKRKLQFRPTKPEKFGGMIDEYSNKLAAMTEGFYKAMARSLNLEEDCFLKHQGKQGPITGRITLYPRCPCPERVLGLKPHSDGATMTFLLPDKEVEGLQVLKDNLWYRVPVIPGALFVNFGDLGEVMTNGEFKSVIHRVVTNAAKDRISVAAFCTPEDEKEIGPVNELVSIHQQQNYKRFNIHEFRQIFFESYAQGRRTIDALKL